MNTALLVIDVQNDYFPGGKMELKNSTDAAVRIKDLLKYFRKEGMPVVHVQHISVVPSASFFVPDTPGVQFNSNVMPEVGERIIVKYLPNCFRNTDLDSWLKENKIRKLVIAGMMTHMCVDTTVRAAFDLGYECILAGDCCATRDLNYGGINIPADDVQNSFLAALNGIFARVVKKDEIPDLLR